MTTKHEVEIGNLNDQLQSVLRLVRQAVEEQEWEIAEACYRRVENMAQKAIRNLYRIQFPSSEPESASKLISFEPIEETDDHSTIASFWRAHVLPATARRSRTTSGVPRIGLPAWRARGIRPTRRRCAASWTGISSPKRDPRTRRPARRPPALRD